MTNAVTIILYVVLVLAVLGGIGAVAYFTSGFTTDFKTFYLTYEGENILDSKSDMEFVDENYYLFEVNYTFGNLSEKKTGYMVKIAPNPDCDLTYYVDGEAHSLKEIDDLTSFFEIEYDTERFSVKGNARLQTVLDLYYSGSVVQLEEAQAQTDYYTMTVYSYNKKASVKINFHGEDAGGTIMIEPDPIEF